MLKHITKGACRLLNDFCPQHIIYELEKLAQQSNVAMLAVENAKLKAKVADLGMEVTGKSVKIWRLNSKSKEGLDRIQNYIDNPVAVINKARLFGNFIKSDGHIFAPKVVAILVDFIRQRVLTLAEMRKLL